MRRLPLLLVFALAACEGVESSRHCANSGTVPSVQFVTDEFVYTDGGQFIQCSVSDGNREARAEVRWRTEPYGGGYGWCSVAFDLDGTPDGGQWVIGRTPVAPALLWDSSTEVGAGAGGPKYMYARYTKAGDPNDQHVVRLTCQSHPP